MSERQTYTNFERLTEDDLYGALRSDGEDAASLDVKLLDVHIEITQTPLRQQTPEQSYINNRLARISQFGWNLHVPSAVSKMRGLRDDLIKTGIDISAFTLEDLGMGIQRKADEEFAMRLKRVGAMRDYAMERYVQENPLYVVVLDDRLTSGASGGVGLLTAPIVDFAILREGDAMLIEPVVRGLNDAKGLLPQMKIADAAYEPKE